MPGKSRKENNTQGTSATWRGFVNITMGPEDWAAVDKARADKVWAGKLAEHIDFLLEQGKLTFNYNNGSISCALTMLEGVNAGLTVSSFSSDLTEAVITTRYKLETYGHLFNSFFEAGGKKSNRG